MSPTLLLALKLSVGAIILAIGMDSRLSDLAYLWKRPGLLLRSLLAMYVLVPLAAFVLVKLLPLPTGVEVALLVLAVSAGAPLLPRKLMHLGQGEYVFSLVVTSTLLAIFIVPVWLALLGPQFGHPDQLEPGRIAVVFAKSFFLPLAVGMLVRRLSTNFAERFGDLLMRAAGLVLVVCALALFTLHWEVILEARWEGVLTLATFTIAAVAIGHWLGGPDREDRTALAVACSTRHLGIAVLVAASVPGPRTAVIVAAYILIASAVTIAYLRWRRRASRASGSGADPGGDS
jgi:BASS family bile acid:Na+ symporter